jgi:hypothetical protein
VPSISRNYTAVSLGRGIDNFDNYRALAVPTGANRIHANGLRTLKCRACHGAMRAILKKIAAV